MQQPPPPPHPLQMRAVMREESGDLYEWWEGRGISLNCALQYLHITFSWYQKPNVVENTVPMKKYEINDKNLILYGAIYCY
jgi:hypothetical protein